MCNEYNTYKNYIKHIESTELVHNSLLLLGKYSSYTGSVTLRKINENKKAVKPPWEHQHSLNPFLSLWGLTEFFWFMTLENRYERGGKNNLSGKSSI